ncbi:hypothetical protein [Mesorhizobium sp. J8]|uniref:hypothetical protein n=1 Tax=Mesorhizobium sp. J8 TaxID=2777475 RepID=UPI0019150BAA|nr:hypothetical protein [Mesorhizobium sp. J8]BCM21033.1 hypothetical protein MJ8_48240 [Mesorhizobium sp. J8]
MVFTRYSGIFTPAELTLLQTVFDTLCKERRLALKDKDQRDDLAREVIQRFESGYSNEDDLLQSLSKRRRTNVQSSAANP